MNYGFVIDNRKCIGCHACSVACKSENQVPVGSHRTWVKSVEKGTFPDARRLFSVTRCNHCANPPCVHICPVTALFQRKDGIVDFDTNLCIGCKACMQACPYDALYINPDKGTAEKCHYCAHRVEKNLEPPCVVVCPEHAIISGDLDDPLSEIAMLLSRETATVRKPEQGTRPKLYYIDGDAAVLTPSAAPPLHSYLFSTPRKEHAEGFFTEPAHARPEARWSGPPRHAGEPEGSRRPSDQTSHAFSGRSPVATAPAFRSGTTLALADLPQASAALLDIPEIADLLARGFPPARTVTRKSRLRRTHDVAHEKPWGASVSAYIFTKSIAAGAFLVAAALGLVGLIPAGSDFSLVATLVSLLFLGITGALLVSDLERPERFLRVLLRPQWRSWLAIGAYIVSAYGALLSAWLASRLLGLGLERFLDPLGLVLAVATAVYTAFLFAQAEGRDFWQSPALGPSLLLHAIVGGSAVLLPVALLVPGAQAAAPVLAWTLVGALAADLFVVLVGELFTPHASADAAAAAALIRSGPYARLFWIVVVGLGHAAAVGIVLCAPASVPATLVGGLLACLGLVTWSHCFVEAGQRPPLS